MNKRKSTFVNMLMTLMVITLVSGFLLGYVNKITLEPKAKVKAMQKVKALQNVLPEFDNNLIQDVIWVKTKDGKDSTEIFPAYRGGKLVGIAISGTSDKGFSGIVKSMVGYSPNGNIFNIEVIEQKETPGLGTKMKDEKFIQQFLGKNPEKDALNVKKDGGKVDALTGATISTRAFCETVESSYEVLKTNREKIENK